MPAETDVPVPVVKSEVDTSDPEKVAISFHDEKGARVGFFLLPALLVVTLLEQLQTLARR